MAEHLQQTPILLEPEQHEKLARIASREHRTISELVREILQAELERREEAVERQSQRLEQLEQLQRNREEMLARRGGKPLNVNVAELLNEMRDERDDEILGPIQRQQWVPREEFLKILRAQSPDPDFFEDIREMGGTLGEMGDPWEK